jgi:hypothetical protein
MGGDSNNDHELLIRLEGKVDTLIEKLKDVPVIEKRVRDLEINCSRISIMETDIKNLETKSNTWSILNSVGVAIAAILSTIGLGR